MSTIDDLTTLLVFLDLMARRVVPNRKTLKKWMEREEDPFPEPIVLAEGKEWIYRDKYNREQRRYSGRRVAWRASDVAEWLERRQKASSKGAA